MNFQSEQIECSRREATTLETVFGILAEPQCFFVEQTGKAGQTWQVREKVAEAQAALNMMRATPVEPEHPVFACLYALEALDSLTHWVKSGTRPATVRTAGRLVRLTKEGNGNGIITPQLAAFSIGVANLHYAAALAVCGFEPLECDGRVIRFAGQSNWLIPPDAFRQATIDATRRSAPFIDASGIRLATYAPGEHPWCYAIQALANDGAVIESQREARKDPVIMSRGRGLRSSIVTQSLLEGRDASLRDSVLRHNKGLPA